MRSFQAIVTHVSTDFDGFSSMVAAGKLYPEAVPVLAGSLNRNVREFSTFYMHDSGFLKARDVDIRRIGRLIVVDTQYPGRLGMLKTLIPDKRVEKIFWDHHPERPGLAYKAPNSSMHIETVGATVSLLVREIRRRGINISALEATLFSLGIYEDTGSLLFSSTSELDLECLLWLRRQGADLKIVSSFLQRALSPEQRDILDQLLDELRIQKIEGFDIAMSTACSREYVEDLDVVVNRVREIARADAFFIAVTMKKRNTYIIARSKFEQIDCAGLLARFGGGGHLFAASASIHDIDAKQVMEELFALLKKEIRPQIQACRIMSAPVRFINSRTTVTAAQRLMLRFGYNALPVVENEKPVGIISRQETERAMRHGLGHAPVSGYMTRRLISAGLETSILELQRSMIENNIGRIPIVEQDKLVGIVTSGDILRHIHQLVTMPRTAYLSTTEQRKTKLVPSRRNYASMLRERYKHDGVESFLRCLGRHADELGVLCYLVGGSVRDLLLGRSSKDLDVVVQRDAIALARLVKEDHGLCTSLTEYPRFNTANIRLRNGWSCDLVTARREYYPGPAQPPEIDVENVRIDLFRRDFTINAMAIALVPDEYGILHDYYGGRRDLAKGCLRVLHNLSFVEDPSRIFRAVRFVARFGFTVFSETAALLGQSLADRVLDHLSSLSLNREFEKTLLVDNTLSMLKCLDKFGVLKHIGWPGFEKRIPVVVYRRFMRARRFISRVRLGKVRDRALPFIHILVSGDREALEFYITRFKPTDKRTHRLLQAAKSREAFLSWLRDDKEPAGLKELKKGLSQAVLIAVGACICTNIDEEEAFLSVL